MRSVLRRPVLLLSVAATVAVPGALAVLAVLGHQHNVSGASAGAGHQAAGLPSGSSSGGLLDGLPSGTGTVSGQAAGVVPNLRTMVPAGIPPGQQGQPGQPGQPGQQGEDQVRGMRLLKLAAAAGRTATYQGAEAIADTTLAGPGTMMARVWHRGGGLTVMQVAGGQPEQTYASNSRDPEGVFGVTPTLVALLEKHYVPVYLGPGSVIGRPAVTVAVRRADGSTAARYWLDARTLLPLRRDVYGPSAHLVSDERFTWIRFGAAGMPKAAPGPGGTAWTAASSPVRLLSGLNAQGSRLPRTLPGDLSLYAASKASTSSGQVTDFGFSDGLSAVSLFVERGSLPSKMPGWEPERVSGHRVYVAQHELTMSGRGFVYTLVYDAPSTTVDATVTELPANGAPGILGRLRRGLGRMVSALDPFR